MKTSVISVCCLLGAMLISCSDPSPADEHHDHMQHDSMPATHDMPEMHHEEADHSNMIMLSTREQLLAGITLDSVRYNTLVNAVTVLGIVEADEQNLQAVSAKVSGRIEKLYARNPGSDIQTGMPLYDLYSEVLLAEQEEYLRLSQQQADSNLTEVAQHKLLLHGMNAAQLKAIRNSGKPLTTLTIYADRAGYVASLKIREGQYVGTGEMVMEIGSLNTVRINAQIYSDEFNGNVDDWKYTIGADSTAEFLYRNPAFESNGRLYNVFLRADNADHALRPGMMVAVNVISGAQNLLSIPRACVLEEKGMFFTWVQEPDGMFNRRMITTGKQDSDFIEITGGLQAGDRIVVTGIYLLNSEFILRKGANSMAGMEM